VPVDFAQICGKVKTEKEKDRVEEAVMAAKWCRRDMVASFEFWKGKAHVESRVSSQLCPRYLNQSNLVHKAQLSSFAPASRL
jgi:hypothetical protein